MWFAQEVQSGMLSSVRYPAPRPVDFLASLVDKACGTCRWPSLGIGSSLVSRPSVSPLQSLSHMSTCENSCLVVRLLYTQHCSFAWMRHVSYPLLTARQVVGQEDVDSEDVWVKVIEVRHGRCAWTCCVLGSDLRLLCHGYRSHWHMEVPSRESTFSRLFPNCACPLSLGDAFWHAASCLRPRPIWCR